MGDDEPKKVKAVVSERVPGSTLTFIYQGETQAGSSDVKSEHNFDNSNKNTLFVNA